MTLLNKFNFFLQLWFMQEVFVYSKFLMQADEVKFMSDFRDYYLIQKFNLI